MSFDIYLVSSFRTYNNLTTLVTIFCYLLLFIFLEVAVLRYSIKKQLCKTDKEQPLYIERLLTTAPEFQKHLPGGVL